MIILLLKVTIYILLHKKEELNILLLTDEEMEKFNLIEKKGKVEPFEIYIGEEKI